MTSNAFTLIVGHNKDAIVGCNAHAAHSILCPELHSLCKSESLNILPLMAGKNTTCFA
jgi:hypothetical protein